MNQTKPRRKIIRNGKTTPIRRNNHKRTDMETDVTVGIGSKSYQKAQQARDKYRELAREALVSGDRVAAEGFFQHADHYNRVINEAHEAEEARHGAASQREEILAEVTHLNLGNEAAAAVESSESF